MNFFVYTLFENIHIVFKAWAFLFAVYILTNAFLTIGTFQQDSLESFFQNHWEFTELLMNWT